MTIQEAWDAWFHKRGDEEVNIRDYREVAECRVGTSCGAACYAAILQTASLLLTFDTHPCVRQPILRGLRENLYILYHG